MGLTNQWELKKQLHLITTNVIELCSLAKFWPCGEEAILRDLVVSNHIFAIRLLGIGTEDREVTHRIISWDAILNLTILETPFHNFRRNEETGVGIAVGIKLGVERA